MLLNISIVLGIILLLVLLVLIKVAKEKTLQRYLIFMIIYLLAQVTIALVQIAFLLITNSLVV